MKNKPHSPDILTCIANLSSDEVFTPPNIAKNILDNLPKEIWSDQSIKFIDPFSKSGVFLREITIRLLRGLEKKIPNIEKRINHILTKQVFGIGITELTSEISRRTVYCSRLANGPYSLIKFDDKQGNIKFFKNDHKWGNSNCLFCGVNRLIYEREKDSENYAYSFIHTTKPENFFNMKFDVIVGNPPYQMSDGGSGTGISAKPIFQHFVTQSIKLKPSYLSMIIPSRWYAGGKGLDDFREMMLNDKRISKLVDYQKSRECFPGVDIAGGVCYFLWDKNYDGKCEYTSILNGETETQKRILNENSIFIRDNIGLKIIKNLKTDKFFDQIVLPRNPFGFISSVRGEKKEFKNSIKLISSGGIGFVDKASIKKNNYLLDYYKVYIGKVNPDRGGVNNSKDGKSNVITKIKIAEPNEVISETYLLIGSFKDKQNANNCKSYFKTKLIRYLILLTLSSMNITKTNFQYVPQINFNEKWDDEKVYKHFKINPSEKKHIESLIKEME